MYGQMIIDIIKEIDTTLLGIEITETGELNSNQILNVLYFNLKEN